jgi:HTH-type transcriptional regulator, transcriptional repressor of NAD biosynthesis genes
VAEWASGGSWEPAPEPESSYPSTGERTHGSWGPSAMRGAHGVVAGRFDPLHRGHQYVIECARAAVEQLTVFVFEARGADATEGYARVHWIRELYPGVEVVLVEAALPRGVDFVEKFATAVRAHVPKPSHLFGSELEYRSVASALGAAFVPVDPARATVPISATAIRANVVENFAFLAPSARPWFVRRVAVVGAESTGKTTLCARLRAEMKLPVLPEQTRIVVEASGGETMRAEDVQQLARMQIAAEDALARQADGGVMVCDTDLLSLWLWTKRLYRNEPPEWITQALPDRDYDLYLLCLPDIPYVGPARRDTPRERTVFHDQLVAEIAKRSPRVVERAGSREERFRTAADAIVDLYAPKQLRAARTSWLNLRCPVP